MLEFVSVLRRLIGGDTKAAPTAEDKVLIVDAADLDRVKTARVGDLPTTSIDLSALPVKVTTTEHDKIVILDSDDYDKVKATRFLDRRMNGWSTDGTLAPPFYGYRLTPGANNVILPTEAKEVLIVNHSSRHSYVSPGVDVAGNSREFLTLYDVSSSIPYDLFPYSAALFNLLRNDHTWVIIPLATEKSFPQLMNIQEDGLLRFPLGKPCRGYHLRGGVKDITLPPVAETLIINDSTGDPAFGSTVLVRPGEGPGPFGSPEANFPRQFVTGEPTYRLGIGDKVTFITDDEGEPRIFILLHN